MNITFWCLEYFNGDRVVVNGFPDNENPCHNAAIKLGRCENCRYDKAEGKSFLGNFTFRYIPLSLEAAQRLRFFSHRSN
ncbi:hypothetical protein [Fischerella thermalis]|uniref:hypothetical protein n=1 Tax=Fischerella thermalis TaxID=372787 RepID=UPI0011AF9532|nr:hypothetical protein [Fischerella thermalis]